MTVSSHKAADLLLQFIAEAPESAVMTFLDALNRDARDPKDLTVTQRRAGLSLAFNNLLARTKPRDPSPPVAAMFTNRNVGADFRISMGAFSVAQLNESAKDEARRGGEVEVLMASIHERRRYVDGRMVSRDVFDDRDLAFSAEAASTYKQYLVTAINDLEPGEDLNLIVSAVDPEAAMTAWKAHYGQVPATNVKVHEIPKPALAPVVHEWSTVLEVTPSPVPGY